jgi:protein TonB
MMKSTGVVMQITAFVNDMMKSERVVALVSAFDSHMMKSKRVVALISAFVVSFLIFILVISLNESDMSRDELLKKHTNFDVQKQQKIVKPKVKKKQPRKPKKVNQPLPSIKPTDVGTDLSGSGLSFGLPSFDDANFANIADNGLLDSFANKTMDKDSVDTAPKVKRRSPIVYPELARRQGISGYVIMNVLVDEHGNVEDVQIIDSEPKDIFDLKADSTVRRWLFEPATYNGKAVKVWATQKIVFKLD